MEDEDVLDHDIQEICSICFDISPISRHLTCSCLSCEQCLVTHLSMKIQDGDIRMTCPVCAKIVPDEKVIEVVPSDLFGVYRHRVQEAERLAQVQKDPLLCWCPKPDCDTAVSRPTTSTRSGVCSTCGYHVCFDCLGPAHGASCDQARKKRAAESGRTEEIEFLKWAKRMTKKCPNTECLMPIERVRGESGDCNHMICSKCHTEFCWLCGQKVPPIGHFNPTNVFGCPGLQYSGPDVNLATRLSARARALRLGSVAGIKRTARVGGVGLLCIAAIPVAVAVGIPYGAYRGVVKLKEKASRS